MLVIELFCSAGGLASGFRQAGIEITLAIDKDPNVCASYERNLRRRPIQMDASDLLELIRAHCFVPRPAGGRPYDLVIADPPCTPWSRAGKRKGLQDNRDMIAQTVELIRDIRPRTFLICNVPGLDDESNAASVRSTIGSLWRAGYEVDYTRLDAACFGVPQHRVRPFWFGRPRGSAKISWPLPTHGEVTRQGVFPGCELKPWVTCRDALAHLPPKEIGRPVNQKYNRKHRASNPDHPSQTVSAGTSRSQKNTVAAWRQRRSRTITTKRSNRLEWPWDRPATGVTCEERLPPPGHNEGHGKAKSGPNAIALSEKAGALLQGFPDGYVFVGENKKVRWNQIGQAVPPALAAAVGRSIVEWFARYDAALGNKVAKI